MKGENEKFQTTKMRYAIYKIIGDGKEVEVYGNKFIFNPAEDSGGFNVTINGKEFSGFFEEPLDGSILKINSKGDSNNFCFKNNHKTYLYDKNGPKVPVSIILNQDLSLREMSTHSRLIAVDDKNERCYLPMRGFHMINQNFYTFDKNKNITGIKQQETFEIDSTSIGQETFKIIGGYRIKHIAGIGTVPVETPKIVCNYNYIDDALLKAELSKMKLSKIKEKEAFEKIELFTFLSKKAKERNIQNFYTTFTKDGAFALVGRKLFFAKKTDIGYKVIKEKDIECKGFIYGLTAFNGKVFVEYQEKNSDSFPEERVLVFDGKETGNLQLELVLKDVNSFELGCFDSKRMCLSCDKYEFQEKLKTFFDKKSVIKDNKKKSKKITSLEEGKKKKCNIF